MRHRLPNRRPSLVQTFDWKGEQIHMGLGFDPITGAPQEMFLNGHKVGSELQTAASDGAVAVSIALQCGADLGTLTAAMGWAESFDGKNEPSSLLGKALREACRASQKDQV